MTSCTDGYFIFGRKENIMKRKKVSQPLPPKTKELKKDKANSFLNMQYIFYFFILLHL